MPGYLSFEGGFLYVAPQLTENAAAFYVDESGTMVEKNIPHCDLFIWPQMFSETKICVTLYEETSSVSCMVDRSGHISRMNTFLKQSGRKWQICAMNEGMRF